MMSIGYWIVKSVKAVFLCTGLQASEQKNSCCHQLVFSCAQKGINIWCSKDSPLISSRNSLLARKRHPMYTYQDCGNFCTAVFIFADGAKTAPIEKILYPCSIPESTSWQPAYQQKTNTLRRRRCGHTHILSIVTRYSLKLSCKQYNLESGIHIDLLNPG